MANTGRVLRGLAALAVAFASSAAGAASGDSYEDDPAGLIASRPALTTNSVGSHDWQVWVCEVPGGSLPVTPIGSAQVLNNYIGPYFSWLSQGRYQATFTPAQIVTATRDRCISEVVRTAVDTGATGAIIVTNEARDGGLSHPGTWCPGTLCPGLSTTYPDNHRSVLLEGEALAGGSPRLMTAAHEIGHSFHLGHSFTGLTTGTWAEYDNRIDILSGGTGDRTELIGTPAINRYAAGWLNFDQIHMASPGDVVTIGPIGSDETQMAVYSAAPGVAVTLDVRVRAGYDVDLDGRAEGVTLHRVDETTEACSISKCTGLNRRVEPLGAAAYSFDHVLTVGDSAQIAPGVLVEVTGRSGDRFTVAFHDSSAPRWPAGAELEFVDGQIRWQPAYDTGSSLNYEVRMGDSTLEVAGTSVSVPQPTDGVDLVEVTPVDGLGNRGEALGIHLNALPPSLSAAVHDPVNGKWRLRTAAGDRRDIYFGVPQDIPLMCDWDGDGVDTVGLYRPSDGYLYLRNSNTTGVADTAFFYGIANDVPMCGDWNGDGTDTVGVYRPTEQIFYLKNSNRHGVADWWTLFGDDGDFPFAGDWDGDGAAEIGVYRPETGMMHSPTSAWYVGEADRRRVVAHDPVAGIDRLYDAGAVSVAYAVVGPNPVSAGGRTTLLTGVF